MRSGELPILYFIRTNPIEPFTPYLPPDPISCEATYFTRVKRFVPFAFLTSTAPACDNDQAKCESLVSMTCISYTVHKCASIEMVIRWAQTPCEWFFFVFLCPPLHTSTNMGEKSCSYRHSFMPIPYLMASSNIYPSCYSRWVCAPEPYKKNHAQLHHILYNSKR